MKLTVDVKISDDDLIRAISLIISDCFTALNLANAMGGHQSTPWKIVRQFTPREMFDEAKARGIDLESIIGAVAGPPMTKSPLYQKYVSAQGK